MKITRIDNHPITYIEGLPAGEKLSQWLNHKVLKVTDCNGRIVKDTISSIGCFSNNTDALLTFSNGKMRYIRHILSISYKEDDQKFIVPSLKKYAVKEILKKEKNTKNLRIPDELKTELQKKWINWSNKK